MSDSVCPICETATHGIHFGVPTCRACAAFFRRTNKLQLKYKCRFNQECNVSHQNRYTCRYCRYEKCVAVGMVNEFFDTQQLPSCLTSPETDASSIDNQNEHKKRRKPMKKRNGTPTRMLSDETSKHSSMKTRLDALFAQNSRVNSLPYDVPLTICQQALLAFSAHRASWPKLSSDEILSLSRSTLDIRSISDAYRVETENTATLCMFIQPFVDLPLDQKWVIYRNFWPRFVEMCRVHLTCGILGYEPEDTRALHFDGSIVTLNSKVVRLEVLTNWDAFKLRDFMRGSNEVFKEWFSIPFKKTAPDVFELMYLAMSMMWNVKNLANISACTLAIAENVNRRLSEDLYNYYAFELKKPNFADRIYKLSHLVTAMDRFQERRKEDNLVSRTFNIFKYDGSCDFFKKDIL